MSALAAALFAVDPCGLGGVALRASAGGSAGAARDQWLALLKNLLPANTPQRRIPLNINDAALLGGLDLGATLSAGRPIAQQGVLAHYRYRVMQPLCAALYKSSPAKPGGQDVIVLMLQPLGEEQVIAHCLLVYHDDGLADTGMIAFQQMIFGEDKPLLESQRPRRLPLDGPLEAHMRCDLSSATYRRWLKARGMRFAVHIGAPDAGTVAAGAA